VDQNLLQHACPPLPATSRQMILVIAATWNNYHARLHLCEKNAGMWRVVKDFSAVCGQKGMAWGLGLYPSSPQFQPRPAKTEGDRKSPAGVFQLGICLGYAPKLTVNPVFPYRQITATMQGVDDPASRYYNRVIDCAQVQAIETNDWNSYEVMRRADDLYKWLIVIHHNFAAIPGAGSLIFMHVWENAAAGTAGCTALPEEDLLEVISWLNPGDEPILVQLPQTIYDEKQPIWKLPLLG
jgi:L,D-peptidoglycan transpeptidase YkuD (ErfK/YbiS/YcfS/YnhG family)